MHLLEDSRKLTHANQQVVDFLQNHDVAKTWGKGTIAKCGQQGEADSSVPTHGLIVLRILGEAIVAPAQNTQVTRSILKLSKSLISDPNGDIVSGSRIDAEGICKRSLAASVPDIRRRSPRSVKAIQYAECIIGR